MEKDSLYRVAFTQLQPHPYFTGSMVAFGMRLLHAELPHHLGRSQETLDRFYYILAITQKVIYFHEVQKLLYTLNKTCKFSD